MITVHCVICGEEHMQIPVSLSDVVAWRESDTLIQVAFPRLSDDQREMLLSGIGPKCFDEMFKEEE